MISPNNFPATIRTAVSQSAITRVGWLFNGTAGDVLAELLQNARRAGATSVAIELLQGNDRTMLVVRDNGCGIDDPATLVTLGQSGWDNDITVREDPAGMGVFSLAGHRVTIRSFSRVHDRGWRVTIAGDAWETSTPLLVETDPIACGTEIAIDLSTAWADELTETIAAASHHYPLPVTFNGERQAQAGWLDDALHVVEWRGSQIGVFHARCHGSSLPSINFHGLTVACKLPTLGEVDRGGTWFARVDIGDTPALQLVLPARKEMVANAALEELRIACRRSIFEAIRLKGAHRLSFADHETGRALGVDLPAATPYLFAWTPPIRDHASAGVMGGVVTDLADKRVLLVPDMEADLGQSAARVLKTKATGMTLVEPIPQLEGYPWYDVLPRMTNPRFMIERNGKTSVYDERGVLDDAIVSGPVDRLTFAFGISVCEEPTRLPADILVAVVDDFCSDIDATTVLLASGADVTVPELVDLLERASFSSSDDCDDDSHWTQTERFRSEATQLATALLLGEDEAILGRVRELLADHDWIVPEGRTIGITLTRTAINAAFMAEPPIADAA